MADISKINPNGTEYDIKDAVARGMVEGSKTATGNPITLTDASESYAEELEVTLEPIQDLHGYNKPWVGGAGKNKFNPEATINSKTTVNGNEITLTATGNFQGCEPVIIPVEQDKTYALSAVIPSGCAIEVYSVNSGGTSTLITAVTQPTAIFTVTQTDAVSYRFILGNRTSGAGTFVFDKVQFEESSTATTFAPYSNICPITGYTDANVGRVGKNLFDKSTTTDGKLIGLDGVISNSTRFYSDFIPIKGNTDYYLSNVLGSSSWNTSLHYDKYKNLIGDKNIGGAQTQSGKITSYPNSAYMIINGNIADKDVVQVEEGSTPTSYEPYHSNTTLTPLGRTVYGGKLNVRTGALTVTHGFVDLGSLSWSKSTDYNGFYASVPEISTNVTGGSLRTSIFKENNSSFAWVNFNGYPDNNIFKNYNQFIYVKATQYSSKADFETAVNGQQLTYPLATPQTYQLTPQELKLLKQYNYITTNGTTISLKYQPDNVIGEAIGVSEEYTDRHFAWKKVGEYDSGDLVTIDGEWSEILLTTYISINNGYSMSVVYPFALFGVASLTAFNEANGEITLNSTLLNTKYVSMTGLSGAKMHVYVR